MPWHGRGKARHRQGKPWPVRGNDPLPLTSAPYREERREYAPHERPEAGPPYRQLVQPPSTTSDSPVT